MPEKEEWRDIEGYEGIYQVSNEGRIKRVAKQNNTWPGRILRGEQDKDGYRLVRLYRNGQGKLLKIHRLVCWAFNGPPPTTEHQVNHKNGVKNDNRVSNLEWVTPSEQQIHACYVLGQNHQFNVPHYRGEEHANAKLTAEDVLLIRELQITGQYTLTELGKLFGVTKQNIRSVVSRRTWRHI